MTNPLLQKVPKKSKTGRKLVYFVIFILALIALLTAGWFWAAGKLDETANNTKTQLANNGTAVKCNDQEVKGYPFRLGLFCSSILFADPVNAINVTTGALRSAAQLYKPGHVVAELDSPLNLQVPNLAPLTLDWELLNSSTNVSTTGLNRFSLQGKQVQISANDAGLKDLLGTIETIQLHARPTAQNAQSLDMFANLQDWKIKDDGINIIEPIELLIDLSVDQLLALFQNQMDVTQHMRANGGNANINAIRITTQTGGEFSVKGPVQIGANGLVSGELTLSIHNPQTLANYAGKVFPPAQAILQQAMPFLDGFAKQSGKDIKIKDLKIRLKNGEVFLGFFKIAQLPRLF